MSLESSVAIIVALVAIAISIWQTNQTRKAITQDFRFERAETVRHFTQLYFDFVEKHKGKLTSERFKDQELAFAFWSLLSTEYYFYREGAIPHLIFASWVVDVEEFYAESSEVWQSHSDYLRHYEFLHPDMIEFFSEIYKFSNMGLSRQQLHHQIMDYVYNLSQTKTDTLPSISKDLWS